MKKGCFILKQPFSRKIFSKRLEKRKIIQWSRIIQNEDTDV